MTVPKVLQNELTINRPKPPKNRKTQSIPFKKNLKFHFELFSHFLSPQFENSSGRRW